MKSRTGALRAVAALLVAALIAGPLTVALAGQPEATPAGTSNAALEAARAYVERVAGFINRTLSIAEKYNISLPPELEEKANTSLRLVEMARANLTVNVTLAVMLATRASVTFSSVADYVWQSLPADTRKELSARIMEKMVSERLAVLKRIRARILWAENVSGVNMSMLLNAINKTIERLETAQQLIEEGNLTGAHRIIVQATKEARAEARYAYKALYREAERRALVNIMVLKLAAHVYRLETALNRTLETINTTGNVSTGQLRALAERNRALLRMAERIEKAYPAANESDPVYTVIIAIVSALNASQAYLDMAVNASIEGNTSWVAANLSLAVETLAQALEEARQVQLPVHIEKRVEAAVRQLEKLRKAREKAMESMYAGMSRMLDKKLSELEELYKKYEEGKIPAWRLKARLAAEKLELERLRASLPPSAPDWLIEKINSIIAWIDAHMPG